MDSTVDERRKGRRARRGNYVGQVKVILLEAEADLSMFSIFGQAGGQQKGGPQATECRTAEHISTFLACL